MKDTLLGDFCILARFGVSFFMRRLIMVERRGEGKKFQGNLGRCLYGRYLAGGFFYFRALWSEFFVKGLVVVEERGEAVKYGEI